MCYILVYVIPCLVQVFLAHKLMATAKVSKPSKWFSTKNFKLGLPLLGSLIPTSSHPPPPPPSIHIARPKNSTRKEELLKVFNHFDINGDGKISSEELDAYFMSVGDQSMLHIDDVQRVINDFDSNGDNLLEFDDFVHLVQGEKDEADDDIRRAFEMFDVDKDGGCITPKGLENMFNRLGDPKSLEECVGMIKIFDLDGNGVLDFHEFQQMMRS